MTRFLKGNYRLPKQRGKLARSKQGKTLTERVEEAMLSKLGGSLCFVIKKDTFLWTGNPGEKTRQDDR